MSVIFREESHSNLPEKQSLWKDSLTGKVHVVKSVTSGFSHRVRTACLGVEEDIPLGVFAEQFEPFEIEKELK